MYKSVWLPQNSNTSDAIIIEFLDYVYYSLDSKQRTIAVYLDFPKHSTQLIITYWWVSFCIMASEVSCSTGSSFIWVIGNNTSQSQTVIPQCQTLHWVFHKGRWWAQYFFFSISTTCIDPQIRCVLVILLMIEQFMHLTVTLTMSMPLWIGSW